MFWDILSTFVNVAGDLAQSSAQFKSANFNRNISKFNAATIQQTGKMEESRIRQEARRRAGQIRANVGMSGFALEGSAMDILSESVYQGEYDAQSSRFNTQRAAQSESMQGDLYGMQGRDAKRAGYISAASSLLKGAQPIFESENKPFSLGG